MSRCTPELALLLRGGVDSTITLAALQEIGATKVTAISLAYDGLDNEADIEQAGQSAKIAGAAHRVVRASPADLTPDLASRLFLEFDEPTDNTSRAPSEYFAARAAKELGLDSCLTGLHGETAISDFGWLRQLARLENREAASEGQDVVERLYTDPTLFFSDRAQREVMSEDLDGKAVIRRIIDGFRAGLSADSDYQTFVNVDGVSDRTGRISLPGQTIPRLWDVEERAAFADCQLIEFAQTIPAELRGSTSSERTSRPPLRAAFQEQMPLLAQQPVKVARPALSWRSLPRLVDLATFLISGFYLGLIY